MRGLIYKITGSCGKCYYGSTVNLKQRLAGHYSDNNTCSSNQLRKPFTIEVLRDCYISKRKILYVLEKWYILNNECINKNVPLNYKTKQDANRDYYVVNNSKIKKKKNRKNPCCRCGKIVTVANLKYHQTTELCQLGEENIRLRKEIERLKKTNDLENFL